MRNMTLLTRLLTFRKELVTLWRAFLAAEISTRIQAPGRISTLHRLRGQIK